MVSLNFILFYSGVKYAIQVSSLPICLRGSFKYFRTLTQYLEEKLIYSRLHNLFLFDFVSKRYNSDLIKILNYPIYFLNISDRFHLGCKPLPQTTRGFITSYEIACRLKWVGRLRMCWGLFYVHGVFSRIGLPVDTCHGQ